MENQTMKRQEDVTGKNCWLEKIEEAYDDGNNTVKNQSSVIVYNTGLLKHDE